jgi:hypothetical protein
MTASLAFWKTDMQGAEESRKLLETLVIVNVPSAGDRTMVSLG